MKKKHTVGTISKPNLKIVEIDAKLAKKYKPQIIVE